MREKLAEFAHKQWSGWMEYLFGKCTLNEDGTATIPKWAVDRWTRQLLTPYENLDEPEKESDRKEADVNDLPDEKNRTCSYRMIKDSGIPFPRVLYKSDCGYELCIIEGYERDKDYGITDKLALPSGECRKCKKEIYVPDAENQGECRGNENNLRNT